MATTPDIHDYLFRCPEDLWLRLKDEADRERRTVNAQLQMILEQRYPPPKSRQKKAAS